MRKTASKEIRSVYITLEIRLSNRGNKFNERREIGEKCMEHHPWF
jgi:hypothetical protein